MDSSRAGRAACGLLTFLVAGFTAAPTFAQQGTIAGTIVDSETGEALIGANVVIEGTTIGGATNIDGRYTITNVDPGAYNLVFRYIGYNGSTVQGVEVSPGETATVDVALVPEAIGLEEVVVEARAVQNSEAILLRDRAKAAAVSDAISTEVIGRSASSTAADAMQKVTGASVVGGKYVYVRGLGGRYMNTQLNGTTLPSADPEQNAVPLDLFPAGLLDNIVTTKTFTPDQPGNFTGGSVNIGTKDYPDGLTISLSSSASFNTNVGLGGDVLLYPGADFGVFGFASDDLAVPEPLNGSGTAIPDPGSAFTDPDMARELDRLTKSFNGTMAPVRQSAPLNQSYGLSIGDQVSLGGRPLGVVGSLSYSRSASGYEGGTAGRYVLTGNVNDVDGLGNDFLLNSESGKQEVLWGGLLNLTYNPAPRHEIGANVVYNRNAEANALFLEGTFPRDLSGDELYQTRVLGYTERTLNSYQLRGEHAFGGRNVRVQWNSTFAQTDQEEPDLRFFTNNFNPESRLANPYNIQLSIYPAPTRFFRTLEEENWETDANLSIPFRQWNGLASTFKVGGRLSLKDRTFSERRFRYRVPSRPVEARYAGDPTAFFSDQNVGILEDFSTDRFFQFGPVIEDATDPSGNYVGDQEVIAGFGMVDMPLARRVRLIAGARYETTTITVVSQDPNDAEGDIDEGDILPSVNVVYALRENMNLRAAYGRTIARPTFREIAPFASFNFVGGYTFIGNPGLTRSTINNFDVRWEWFARPGEIFAVSGFYKDFTGPIERIAEVQAVNPQLRFRNVASATVYGVELEARKRFDFLATVLSDLQAGLNLSLVQSEVAIPDDELENIRAQDPDAGDTRSLFGQSPYTLNADLTYQRLGTGTTVSLFYNVFGERLDAVTTGATPDIFEQPQHELDFTFSQDLISGIRIKGAARNLLGASFKLAQEFNGQEFIEQEYQLGRSFSLGLSYQID